MRAGISMGGPSRTFDWMVTVCVCLFSSGLATGNETVPKTISSAFEATVVQLSVKPNDKAVDAVWNYTNHWEIPLLVERFDQSCGCLSGKVAPSGHEAVAPGKSGAIRARFTPSNHRGLLRKSLHVRFVGHEMPVELIVEATIPSTVGLSTRELHWKPDPKSPSAQTIDITSGTGADFAITGLLGVPESRFTITSETLTENRHYRLSITPVGTPGDGIDILQIRTDSPDPRDRVLAVFLCIETPPAAAETSAMPLPPSGS